MNVVLQKSIDEFLLMQPFMKSMIENSGNTVLNGEYHFSAQMKGYSKLTDKYQLRISISSDFPYTIPKVQETAGKIKRDIDNHLDSQGFLCLGSNFRLFGILHQNPTFTCFENDCLIPYLYNIAHKRVWHSSVFPGGELKHGTEGILDDLCEQFNLKTHEQARNAFKAISVDKKIANKQPCPCGCGRILSRCELRIEINKYRRMLSPNQLKVLLKGTDILHP